MKFNNQNQRLLFAYTKGNMKQLEKSDKQMNLLNVLKMKNKKYEQKRNEDQRNQRRLLEDSNLEKVKQRQRGNNYMNKQKKIEKIQTYNESQQDIKHLIQGRQKSRKIRHQLKNIINNKLKNDKKQQPQNMSQSIQQSDQEINPQIPQTFIQHIIESNIRDQIIILQILYLFENNTCTFQFIKKQIIEIYIFYNKVQQIQQIQKIQNLFYQNISAFIYSTKNNFSTVQQIIFLTFYLSQQQNFKSEHKQVTLLQIACIETTEKLLNEIQIYKKSLNKILYMMIQFIIKIKNNLRRQILLRICKIIFFESKAIKQIFFSQNQDFVSVLFEKIRLSQDQICKIVGSCVLNLEQKESLGVHFLSQYINLHQIVKQGNMIQNMSSKQMIRTKIINRHQNQHYKSLYYPIYNQKELNKNKNSIFIQGLRLMTINLYQLVFKFPINNLKFYQQKLWFYKQLGQKIEIFKQILSRDLIKNLQSEKERQFEKFDKNKPKGFFSSQDQFDRFYEQGKANEGHQFLQRVSKAVHVISFLFAFVAMNIHGAFRDLKYYLLFFQQLSKIEKKNQIKPYIEQICRQIIKMNVDIGLNMRDILINILGNLLDAIDYYKKNKELNEKQRSIHKAKLLNWIRNVFMLLDQNGGNTNNAFYAKYKARFQGQDSQF